MLRSANLFLIGCLLPCLLGAQPDTILSCRPGATITLQAPAGQSAYQWAPAVTLSNPTVPNPTVRPLTTTSFVVRSILNTEGDNLFQNPDFEQGSIGFTSDYPFVSAINTQGVYGVNVSAANLNSTFFTACPDHSTGSTNMMVVDGSPAPNAKVWCQTVAVGQNQDYALSAWLTSVNAPNPARLQFSINGAGIGSVFSPGETVCDWRQFYAVWNAGENTSAEVCVINQNTNPQGNDFALDDFSFQELISTRQDTIVVVVAPLEPSVAVRRMADCGDNNGILDVSLAEAGSNFLYVLNDGLPQDSPSFSGLAAGTYELSIQPTGTSMLDTTNCAVSVSVVLPSRDCPTYIPSAFSPDADGINDVFSIGLHPASTAESGQLRVYDRWGGLVFSSERLPPTEISWDGSAAKQPAAAGTYLYVLEIRDSSGVTARKQGTVVLIR